MDYKLTSFGEEDKVLLAIHADAQGYLLKDIPPTELVRALRDAYLGKTQLNPEIAKKLMSAVAASETRLAGSARTTDENLTESEQEVLLLNSLQKRGI